MEDASRIAEYLRKRRRILVFSGAGISTKSGIPDYRGPAGVWKTRKPVFYDEFMSSKTARVRYWKQKLEDWDAFGGAEPNATHRALVRLEEAKRLLMVVTQNVDGLHGKAGTSSARLVELHGTNLKVECQSCHSRHKAQPWYEGFRSEPVPPVCACGGFLKPATISFGQGLRNEDLDRAARAAHGADLVVSLGSTLSVHPAASIPLVAASRGIPYIIVNQGVTAQDSRPEVNLRVDGDVSLVFPRAVELALA